MKLYFFCIFLGFIAVLLFSQPFLIDVQLVSALCSVFSRAHQRAAGGFRLLQRFITVAVDFLSLSHLRVDLLGLYVFYDGMPSPSCTHTA